MTYRQHTFGLAELELYIEEPLGAVTYFTEINHHFALLLLCYRRKTDSTGAHHLAVFEQTPREVVGAEVTEKVLVIYAVGFIFTLDRSNPDILVIIFHLVSMGIGYAVRADESVVAEIVVGGIETVEIPAIDIYGVTILIFPAQRLVNEVPDISALQFGILADHVPVFLETAFAVTHCMGILTLNQRTGIIAFGILLGIFGRGIHRAVDVGMLCQSGALILHGTAAVDTLYLVVGRYEIFTVTGFVTETPHYD